MTKCQKKKKPNRKTHKRSVLFFQGLTNFLVLRFVTVPHVAVTYFKANNDMICYEKWYLLMNFYCWKTALEN